MSVPSTMLEDQLLDIINGQLTANEFRFQSTVTATVDGSQGNLDELYNQIYSMRIARDTVLGIHSRLIDVDGSPVYLRDAQDVKKESLSPDELKEVERCNAKMMALNYLLACQRLDKHYNLGLSQELLFKSLPALERIETADDPQAALITWVNQDLLPHMNKALQSKGWNEKQTSQLINRMTHAAALEQETISNATVLNVNGQQFIQLDIPVCAVSPEYEEEIANRQDKYWYQSLSATDREVVEIYSQQLIDGKHVIPSQLRDLVPGVRNLFHYQVFHVQEDNLKPIIDCNHTGTALTIVRPKRGSEELHAQEVKNANDEMLRLTQLNMRSQLHGAGEGFTLSHMASLNSDKADLILQRNTYFKEYLAHFKRVRDGMSIDESKQRIEFHGDDRAIVKMTVAASSEQVELASSNYVFNGFRVLSSDDLIGTVQTMDNAYEVLKFTQALTHEQPAYQTQVSELKESLEALSDLIEQRQKPLRSTVSRLFRGDAADKEFKGKEVLILTEKITRLSNELVVAMQNSGLNTMYNLSHLHKINFCFGCASGENRTGAGLFHMTLAAINSVCPAMTSADSAVVLANSYHTQDGIGGQGGVLGGAGARYKSKGSWCISLAHITDTFFQHIADIKKKIPIINIAKQAEQKEIETTLREMQETILNYTRPRDNGSKPVVIKMDGVKMTLYLTKEDIKTLDKMQKIRKTFNKTGEYDKALFDGLFPGRLSANQADSEPTHSDSDDEHAEIYRTASFCS